MGQSQLALPFTEEQKLQSESLAEKVLERLQLSATTATELKRMNHRFSAAIRSLRERGHAIDMGVSETGDDVYYWRDYVPLVKVTRQMQDAYYWSPHWRGLRLHRLEFDEYRCTWCRSCESLDVHHWVYDLFEEELSDIQTYCRTCHDRLHEIENVKVHFPRWVAEAVARRLLEALSQQEIDTSIGAVQCQQPTQNQFRSAQSHTPNAAT